MIKLIMRCKTCFNAVTVLILLFTIISVGAHMVKLSNEKPSKIAWRKSKEYITESLVAPSTAKFQKYDSYLVKDNKDETYTVNIYVDSQNSFGAMIRTRYKVTLNAYQGNIFTVKEIKEE